MENASKALLIAGGVLLAILVFSLLLFARNNLSDYYASQEEFKDIQDVTKFNKQFTNYERTDVKGYELISLINSVIDYNDRKSEQQANQDRGKPIDVIVNFDHKNDEFANVEVAEANKLFKDNEVSTYGHSSTKTFKSIYLVPVSTIITNSSRNIDYTNINEAFNDVEDGETLKLTRDASISYNINIPDKQVILDMNGYNLVTNKSIINNGNLSIINSINNDVSITSSITNTLITSSGSISIIGIKINGYDLISSNDYSNISISNCILNGNKIVVGGQGAEVTIINSTITSSDQAINTSGELTIRNTSIVGNTYGIYTNTSEDVVISNSTITATNALYNKGTSTITISDYTEFRGAVNNANGSGTFNMTGGILNGPFGNSGTATINDVSMNYTYDSYDSYSFVNNSGTLTFTNVTVDVKNTNASGPGTNYYDRVVYNTGTFTSNTNEYKYSSTSNTSRVANGIENRGILHSTNDKYTLGNKHYLRAVDNFSINTTEITNATININGPHEVIGYYNHTSTTMRATGGSVTLSGAYAYEVHINTSGQIILDNITSNTTRIGASEGGTINFKNGTSILNGPTSYCLTGTGELNMSGSTCNIVTSTTAYGINLASGTSTVTDTTLNINASGTAYGVKMDNGTTNVQSGTISVHSATAYGVHMTNGTMNVGVEDGSGTQQADMQVDNPHIEAIGTTTGIGSSMGNGTLNYYDGTIIGSTRARAQGDITSAVEKNYQVVTRTDEVTGYEYCILEFIM